MSWFALYSAGDAVGRASRNQSVDAPGRAFGGILRARILEGAAQTRNLAVYVGNGSGEFPARCCRVALFARTADRADGGSPARTARRRCAANRRSTALVWRSREIFR